MIVNLIILALKLVLLKYGYWVYQSLVYSFSNFSVDAFYRLLLLTIYYCCLAYFEMLVTPIISTQIP